MQKKLLAQLKHKLQETQRDASAKSLVVEKAEKRNTQLLKEFEK